MSDWYWFYTQQDREEARRDRRFKTGELVHDSKPQGDQTRPLGRLRAALRRAFGRMQAR